MSRIGITLGDVAGIGPEVVTKALATSSFEAEIKVYGAPRFVETPGFEVADVLPEIDWSDFELGQFDPRAARLQLAALEAAIADVKAGTLDAIVTAPWNKALFETIGHPPVGHTEVLSEAFDCPVTMMLGGDALRVSLVTTHLPLADVSAALSPRKVRETIERTAAGLTRFFGIAEPRLAVCGLNPHAGERGTMGSEELEIISPMVELARVNGIDVSGPYPADTLFARFHGEVAPYDAVVCMYHDQGLIPLKLKHFGNSANFTLGLPVLRSSVDHGTAYDIAGQGRADAGSMIYAIRAAIEALKWSA